MKLFITCLIALAGLNGFVNAKEPDVKVKLETSSGDIIIQLDSKAAPKTVANFLSYVNSGFYDGTIFHRVIKGFMVQGGGFTPDMEQKKTNPPVDNEANNGLKNLRGTIAMARTMAPHSATAQFFINTVDNNFLDHTAETEKGWGYCVFGKVVSGMPVIDVIEKSETASNGMFNDVPVKPVIIKKASVLKEEAPDTKK